MIHGHAEAESNRGRAGIRLLLGLGVMLGLMVGSATAQVTPDTMATAGQEITDATILDILITSNEAEVMTSEVIAGEEAAMPEEEPMGPPPPEEAPPPPEDTMGVGEDTMGVGQDTATYGDAPQDTMYGEQQPQAGAEPGPGAMGQDEAVQEYARRMIDEHSRLNDEAWQLSDSLGVEPEANLVSTVLQNTVEGVTEELRGTSAESLDQEYMMTQVVLHQQALGMLEHTLIPNAEDESLRGLLEEARGVVAQHLDQARDIFGQLAQEQFQPAE